VSVDDYFLGRSDGLLTVIAHFLTLVLKTIGHTGNVRTGAIPRQLDNNTYGRAYVERPEASDTATNVQRRVSATSSPVAYVVDGGSVYVDAREQAMVGEHHRRGWISAAAMGERVPAMDWNGAPICRRV
jgi:hypothetical protein